MCMAMAAALYGLAAMCAGQAHEGTSSGGRVFSVPASIPGCGPATVSEDSRASLGLDYVCDVAPDQAAAARATVWVVVLKQALQVAPRDFLIGQSQRWWPDMAAEDRAANISVQTKVLANGAQRFHCIHRDDVANLAGDALCVLDAPTIEVLIAGRSTMALTADAGVDAVLKAATIG